MDVTGEDIGKKVRFLLGTQGISCSQAAEQLGIPDDHFQEIVDGHAVPTQRLLQKLADLCGVKPEFLTGKKEASSGRAAVQSEASVHRAQPEPARAERKGARPLPSLAVRFEALLECLFDRRILTPLDYKRKLGEVARRGPRASAGGHRDRARPPGA